MTWRPVRGFEGIYEVSDEGQVRRVAPGPFTSPGRILKPRPSQKGYFRVALHYRGVKRETGVHRLVAEVFLPEPESGQRNQVNHIDGNKANNRAANLEWATGSENIRHGHRLGLFNMPTGEAHGRAKLTAKAVREIRQSSATGVALAANYGVSSSLIYADAMSLHEVAGFVNGTSWMRLCSRCLPAGAYPVLVGEGNTHG